MAPPPIPTKPAFITAREISGDFGIYYTNWTLTSGPQIDSEGRISPTMSVKDEAYLGFFTVYVNGTDYTFFRGQVSKPLEGSSEDPGGDSDFAVLFPITALEELGTGALADFHLYANVETWLAVPALATQYRLDQGSIKRWGYRDNLLVAYCRGAGRQLDDYIRETAITDEPADIDQLAAGEASHVARAHLAGRLNEWVQTSTGINSRFRGDKSRSSDFLAKLFSLAWDPFGGPGTVKYTWLVDGDRNPYTAQVVDPQNVVTPDFIVDFGAEGVELDVEQDGGTIWNVAYLSGQDPGGQPLDNLYPLAPNGVFHQPGSFDPIVHDVVDDGTGTLVTDAVTGPFDATAWRIETEWDFGPGVGRDEATGILNTIRLMLASGENWAGALRMNGADPKGGDGSRKHKFLMRENMTVGVRWFHGSGSTGIVFRIAQSNRNYEENSVGLVIDTKLRDIQWLEAIANREDVKAKNPIARLNIGTDAVRPVSKAVWDSQKSGWIPNDDTHGHRWADSTVRWTLTGNAWNVLKFLASESEDFYRFEFHLDEDEAYHISLYNMDPTDISHTKPVTDISDPFIAPSGTPVTGPWDPPLPDGFINGWGQTLLDGSGATVRDAAGFYPYSELDDFFVPTGHTATGDFVIQGDYSFDHDEAAAAEEAGTGVNEPAYLWVAVRIPTAGTFHGWGRLLIRPGRK